MTSVEEFCAFLKQREFKEFMKAWKTYYESYGKLGGSITIPLTIHNQKDIESLMSRSYGRDSEACIIYNQFKKELAKTKYADVKFEDVLFLYFDGLVLSKKQRKVEKQEKVTQFVIQLCENYNSTNAWRWFEYCMEANNVTFSRIVKEIHKDYEKALREVSLVMEALNRLPLIKEKQESIALFSSKVTRHPHEFDKETFMRYLLNQGILTLFGSKKVELTNHEILALAGIYEDKISNYCMLCHLNAIDYQGKQHQGWSEFYHRYEPWNVNMQNIKNINEIDSSQITHVFIVENPSVFELLCNYAKSHDYKHFGFVCTSGQLNASAYALLDKIADKGIQMYYGGDFDPEGLLIAEKLKNRYNDNLVLWHYGVQDIEQALSSYKASKRRIVSLDALMSPDLILVAKIIREKGLGYQENIMNAYLSDLNLLSKI